MKRPGNEGHVAGVSQFDHKCKEWNVHQTCILTNQKHHCINPVCKLPFYIFIVTDLNPLSQFDHKCIFWLIKLNARHCVLLSGRVMARVEIELVPNWWVVMHTYSYYFALPLHRDLSIAPLQKKKHWSSFWLNRNPHLTNPKSAL